jgi:hypothetical protein
MFEDESVSNAEIWILFFIKMGQLLSVIFMFVIESGDGHRRAAPW